MEDEVLQNSKELIMNSRIGEYVAKEKVDADLGNIYVYESQEKKYKLYEEKTGKEYDGYLAGFNNEGISCFSKIANLIL